MYLNRVYYGNQSYGVEAAAQGYFGKSARRDVPRTDDGIPVQTKERESK